MMKQKHLDVVSSSKIFNWNFVLRLLLVCLSCISMAHTADLDQTQLKHDKDNDFNEPVQTFTAGADGYLTQVKFMLRGMSNYSGGLKIELKRTDSEGVPVDAVLSVGVIDGSQITDELTWVSLNFMNPYFQSVGEKLALHHRYPDLYGGYENGWVRTGYTTSNSYEGGSFFHYYNNSYIKENYDLSFQTITGTVGIGSNDVPLGLSLGLSKSIVELGSTVVVTLVVSGLGKDSETPRLSLNSKNYELSKSPTDDSYSYVYKPNRLGTFTFSASVGEGESSISKTATLNVLSSAPASSSNSTSFRSATSSGGGGCLINKNLSEMRVP